MLSRAMARLIVTEFIFRLMTFLHCGEIYFDNKHFYNWM